MKKILYCASSAGHLRSFHKPYMSALVQEGSTVTVAAAGTGEGLPEGVRFLSVPFTKSFFSPRNLKAVLQLARLIRRERFDLILVHTSLAAFFTRLALALAGKKNTRVVNTVHGYLFGEQDHSLRGRILLTAEKMVASVTDDILTMNDEDTRIANTHHLCRGRVVQIDGMGVDADYFRPPSPEERTAARDAMGVPAESCVMLYAAEFSRRKNQRFLIECMPALPGSVILLLPGEGELLEECRSLAGAMGLADRVQMPGYITGIRNWIWASDICVSSSWSEGLPFHVMESMSCGVPVLLSDVKGNADLVRDGAAGLLYPAGSHEGFREAAAKLLDAPDGRAAMTEAARKSISRFDLKTVMPRVMDWYR